MPSRESFAYRRAAQMRALKAQESTASTESTIYTQAANDFGTFCTLLGKPPVRHMLDWHKELITGQSNKYLLDIAGPNTDILSPRGSSKSTVLNMLTAWCIGRHTAARMPLQIIYVSYNIATAIPKSRIIKQIVDSTEFKKVFPNCRLKPGMQSDIGWSIDFEYAGIPRLGDEEFTLRAAGLRGSITSKRAHLCLPADSLVHTDKGLVKILDIFREPEKYKVPTYNSRTCYIEWSGIRAVCSRGAFEIVSIKTSTGGSFECTPEHPIYTKGRGVIPAGDVVVGDKLFTFTDRGQKETKFCSVMLDSEDSSETVSSTFVKHGHCCVYDLETESENHNFLISLGESKRLLVSNCIVDDPIKSSTDIRNPAIREEQNSNWSSVIAPIIFEGGRSICLGTRFHPLDIHKTMFIPAKGWKQVVQEAITYDNQGNPVSYWPEQWSVDYLLKQKELDPVAFAFQYQQQPVLTSDLIVSPDLLVKGEVSTEFDSLAVGIDLSASKNETSDYTAFVLGGRLGDKYYIIDAHQCRSIGNLEKIDLLCEMLLEWGILIKQDGEYFPTYSTVTLVVESVAYQASLAADIRRVLLNERGLGNLHIHEIKGFRGDKIARFRGTLGLLEHKKVTFNKYRKFDALFDQLINVGATAHDDLLDAYVWLMTFLQRRGSFSIEY